MLKHGNDLEITKNCFSMTCQTRKYFFPAVEILFKPHSFAYKLLGLLLLKLEKRPRKSY